METKYTKNYYGRMVCLTYCPQMLQFGLMSRVNYPHRFWRLDMSDEVWWGMISGKGSYPCCWWPPCPHMNVAFTELHSLFLFISLQSYQIMTSLKYFLRSSPNTVILVLGIHYANLREMQFSPKQLNIDAIILLSNMVLGKNEAQNSLILYKSKWLYCAQLWI